MMGGSLMFQLSDLNHCFVGVFQDSITSWNNFKFSSLVCHSLEAKIALLFYSSIFLKASTFHSKAGE